MILLFNFVKEFKVYFCHQSYYDSELFLIQEKNNDQVCCHGTVCRPLFFQGNIFWQRDLQ